nr:hypothetical protein Itr_chr12CG07470 [Ipomoea trifida]
MRNSGKVHLYLAEAGEERIIIHCRTEGGREREKHHGNQCHPPSPVVTPRRCSRHLRHQRHSSCSPESISPEGGWRDSEGTGWESKAIPDSASHLVAALGPPTTPSHVAVASASDIHPPRLNQPGDNAKSSEAAHRLRLQFAPST